MAFRSLSFLSSSSWISLVLICRYSSWAASFDPKSFISPSKRSWLGEWLNSNKAWLKYFSECVLFMKSNTMIFFKGSSLWSIAKNRFKLRVCNHRFQFFRLSRNELFVKVGIMKFFIPTILLFLLTSCDTMEIQAGEDSMNSSPCSACPNCGNSDTKEEIKPTS